jgi:hypothetical protein
MVNKLYTHLGTSLSRKTGSVSLLAALYSSSVTSRR